MRGERGNVLLGLLDRQILAELLAPQHLQELSKQVRADDEREPSFAQSTDKVGRRAERSDDR
jgi:hypothetical protein